MGNGFKENSRTRETKEQKESYDQFWDRVFNKNKEEKKDDRKIRLNDKNRKPVQDSTDANENL